jgi:hypothetical protein
MRTRSWASLLLAVTLASSSAETLKLPSGTLLSYFPGSGCTNFVVPSSGKGASNLCLQRDSTVAQDASPTSVSVVAEVPNVAIILKDTYDSIPSGMSYCQAGEEIFLRVIAVKGKQAKETYKQKVASCRQNIELADPGLTWSAESRTVTIHWISSPKGIGKTETQSLTIEDNGQVRPS